MPADSGEDILARLFEMIEERARLRPADSYVTNLFEGGQAAIAAKVREEAEELIEAASASDRAHTVHEAADLFFHVCVQLVLAGVSLRDVLAELESRFGVSGLVEKASRQTSGEG
ncbi:MAG: phosphoribosyl-ATP diphosphatase [bacterium]|nr:phosphoribosyl-ATP diphosphatase [bacterium]